MSADEKIQIHLVRGQIDVIQDGNLAGAGRELAGLSDVPFSFRVVNQSFLSRDLGCVIASRPFGLIK